MAEEPRATTIRYAVAASLVLLLVMPPMSARAGEVSDRVTRALSGADTTTGPSIPALPLRRAEPEADRAYAAYLKTIEAKLTAKARELGHPRYAGKVVVCFHIAPDGRISSSDLCVKSGNPSGDRFALAVVAAVGPLPPPPPSNSNGGVVWAYSFKDDPHRR